MITERSENSQATPPDNHTIRPPLHTEGKMAAQRIPAQRLLALVLLLVSVTLGMLTSLLFMASRHEPTKMIGMVRSLPEHVSSHDLIMGGGIIATIGLAIVGTLIGLALYVVNTLIHPKRNDHFIPLTPFVLDLPMCLACVNTYGQQATIYWPLNTTDMEV